MPSPLGHALGGLAVGWLLRPADTGGRWPGPWHRASLAFAALAVAPDLDLLAHAHRGPTHSLGATLVVGVIAWLALRGRAGRTRLALACAGAYGSHVLLDWLGSDIWPPLGLQALWPWSPSYFAAPWPVFMALSRQIHHPASFWVPNALAITRELLLLVPLLALVYALRRPRS